MSTFDAADILSALKKVKTKTTQALRAFAAINDGGTPALADGAGARERITALFDAGTFVELGAFVKRRASQFDTETPDEPESVITGYGAVDGRLVFAFAQDFSRSKGAVSEAAAKKVNKIYKLALENGAPIVGIFDSAGASLADGVSAMSAYGSMMSAASAASGVIPQLAMIPGICAGSAAVFAAMTDFILLKKGASLYLNPPTLTGEVPAASDALAAVTADSESELFNTARMLLSVLPSNNAESAIDSDSVDDPARACITAAGGDIADNIRDVADNGIFTELYANYAPEIAEGFISLCGITSGVIANRKTSGGTLTATAARKAARFVNFCDSFNIPLLTLVDCAGFDVTKQSENAPYAAELGKLAGAYAQAKTPLITVVIGEAYGTAFTVLGPKSLGADVVYAVDGAKIGALPAKSAVALLLNDKIGTKDENGVEYTREALEAKWDEAKGNAVEAAYAGEIDDIIDMPELRARVCAAVNMLVCKDKRTPPRRHANLPL